MTKKKNETAATPTLTIEAISELINSNNETLLAAMDEKIASVKPVVPEKNENEPSPAQEALQKLHEANLSGLSDEQKEMLVEIAGDDVIQQVNVFASMKKRGVFESKGAETTTETKTGDGNDETGKKGDDKTTQTTQTTQTPAPKPVVQSTSSKVNLNGGGTPPKPPETLSEALAIAGQKMNQAQR